MTSPTVSRPAPVRLVFVNPGPAKRTSSSASPQAFTELPADRADKAPKKADFLSNVTSRARDRVQGDAAMPRMQGDVDAPMVKMQADGAAAPPAQPFASHLQAAEPPPSQTATSTMKGPLPQNTSNTPATGDDHSPADARHSDALRPSTGTSGHSGIRGLADGNSDINQPEGANPNGSSSLTGDISLNTTAWDYAPWIQRFGRQLMRVWIPPPAYQIGILKEGGWATFELEISKSGKLLRLNELEEQGHPSLAHAAESAIRTMGAIEPLPSNFPEPTLILRLRMIYPRIHPR